MIRPLLTVVLNFSIGLPAIAETAFEKDVLPIFTAHCLQCHGGLKQKNDLDLRTAASLLQGGQSGPAAVSGKADQSLLWKKIAADEMPAGISKLSADDKKVIRAWIDGGMKTNKSLAQAKIPAMTQPRDPKTVAAEMDRDIDRTLAQHKQKAAGKSEDTEFLRRVYLDILGRLPTSAEVKAFLADAKADKRGQMIDQLLADPAFGGHFGRVWHNLLIPLQDGKRTYEEPLIAWLAKGFNESRGWDETVRELITAQGAKAAAPQTAFLINNRTDAEPDKLAFRAGRLFLGVNLECAECHNHPLAEWKQSEYWGLAAFFSKVSITKGQTPTVAEVEKKLVVKRPVGAIPTGAAIAIPDSALTNVGTVVPAHFPNGVAPTISTVPYRPTLASWITEPGNPWFAPASVNRLWAHFFGRGFVHPLDNFQLGNPPSHPDSLATLAQEFRLAKHDVKHVIRCICNTQAYQRTSRSDGEEELQQQLFGRMPLRLVSHEVLYKALTQGLGVNTLNIVDPLAAAARNGVRPSNLSTFVNTFDVTDDETDPLVYSHGVLHILRLLNQRDFNQGGEIAKTLALKKVSPEQAVEELYLRTLSRQPTTAERERLLAYIRSRGDAREAYAAVLWLLFNQPEFVLNH